MKTGLWPDISAKGGVYGDKSASVDWFGMLFERVRAPLLAMARRLDDRSAIQTSKVRDVSELGFRAQYEMRMSLARAQ